VGTNNTSRVDTKRSDLRQTPLAKRKEGRHTMAERHRVGRKTQLDKNKMDTNNTESGHEQYKQSGHKEI